MEHVAVRAYCMFEGFSANYCSIIVASKSHGEAFGPHKKSRASDLALALKLVRSMGLEPIFLIFAEKSRSLKREKS